MHGRWPPGKRCAVGLSFDFDAETIWFRTLRQPFAGQMSRGEYGAREGVPRILDLLQRYDLKASFFVPGWTADKYPQLVERMHAAGHEIGHHGYEHEYVVDKGAEIELEVLSKGIESLRRLTGAVPKGYRAPAGNLGPHTLESLPDHGFTYDSSLVGGDEPYWIQHARDGAAASGGAVQLGNDRHVALSLQLPSLLRRHVEPEQGLRDLARRVRGRL